jgi:two-component system, chemotaxis family, response regulator WspF
MRIGIVNDLTVATEALRRAVALEPAHEVVWTARDGREAVALCESDKPDLVLMDLIMPGMDGVEATRRIMSGTPCAILVVTASVDANAERVFEAMGHGALDAVDTPLLAVLRPAEAQARARPLLAKIASIGRLIALEHDTPGALAERAPADLPAAPQERLLAIGASAGGPAALAKILSALPKDLPAAVVVVQHVDEQFAVSMADWLSQQSALPVRVAREGDRPAAGTVLLAGSKDHLAFKSAGRLGYTPEPVDYAYRPSIDVFFHSVCRFWAGEAVGVLLTGMGRDGAAGLKAMRDNGCHTIAQDRASSAVYGMPKAAAALDAAVEILSLQHIAPQLVRRVTRK